MLEGHTVEGDGTIWRLTLREGLRFHDGVPVLARDAVASIRRCALRDGFCQTLMAVTDEPDSCTWPSPGFGGDEFAIVQCRLHTQAEAVALLPLRPRDRRETLSRSLPTPPGSPGSA